MPPDDSASTSTNTPLPLVPFHFIVRATAVELLTATTGMLSVEFIANVIAEHACATVAPAGIVKAPDFMPPTDTR
jgi:hypothetical protein